MAKIKIKKSKKGTFTKAAKKRGIGVQEFAKKVLANKDQYSSAMVKKANFARNASKWDKELGGDLYDLGGALQSVLPVLDNFVPGLGTGASILTGLIADQGRGEPARSLKDSTDPFTAKLGGTFKQYNAPSHRNGGQRIDINGNPTFSKGLAEIEKEENMLIDPSGEEIPYIFSDELGTADKAAKIERTMKGDDSISRKGRELAYKALKQENEVKKSFVERMKYGGSYQTGGPFDPPIDSLPNLPIQAYHNRTSLPLFVGSTKDPYAPGGAADIIDSLRHNRIKKYLTVPREEAVDPITGFGNLLGKLGRSFFSGDSDPVAKNQMSPQEANALLGISNPIETVQQESNIPFTREKRNIPKDVPVREDASVMSNSPSLNLPAGVYKNPYDNTATFGTRNKVTRLDKLPSLNLPAGVYQGAYPTKMLPSRGLPQSVESVGNDDVPGPVNNNSDIINTPITTDEKGNKRIDIGSILKGAALAGRGIDAFSPVEQERLQLPDFSAGDSLVSGTGTGFQSAMNQAIGASNMARETATSSSRNIGQLMNRQRAISGSLGRDLSDIKMRESQYKDQLALQRAGREDRKSSQIAGERIRHQIANSQNRAMRQDLIQNFLSDVNNFGTEIQRQDVIKSVIEDMNKDSKRQFFLDLMATNMTSPNFQIMNPSQFMKLVDENKYDAASQLIKFSK